MVGRSHAPSPWPTLATCHLVRMYVRVVDRNRRCVDRRRRPLIILCIQRRQVTFIGVTILSLLLRLVMRFLLSISSTVRLHGYIISLEYNEMLIRITNTHFYRASSQRVATEFLASDSPIRVKAQAGTDPSVGGSARFLQVGQPLVMQSSKECDPDNHLSMHPTWKE